MAQFRSIENYLSVDFKATVKTFEHVTCGLHKQIWLQEKR